MESGVLATARERHFKADNMRDQFENINMDDVFSFRVVPKNIIHHYNLKYSMDQPTNLLYSHNPTIQIYRCREIQNTDDFPLFRYETFINFLTLVFQ